MNRPTDSARIALERIKTIYAHVDLGRKTTWRALAFLADMSKRQRLDRVRTELVRWCGTVPSRGVKGWEVEALEWLRLK